MGNLTKCVGFFVGSLVVLSTALCVLYSDSTNAWTGNLPQLSYNYDWDWTADLKEYDNDISLTAGSYFHGEENGADDWSAFFWSDQPLVVWDRFANGNYSIKPATGAKFISAQINLETHEIDSMQTNPSWANNGIGDWVGYYSAKNLVFDPSYTGDPIDDGGVPGGGNGGNDESCEGLDVGCWLGNFTGTIVDGFQGLADLFTGVISGLGNWIANLIMPKNDDGEFENIFVAGFQNILSTLEDRLGFLLFPIQFISTLQSAIFAHSSYGDDESNCSGQVAQSLVIPNLLGSSSVSINPCLIVDTPVWNPMKIVLRTVFVLGVIGVMYAKYNSVVKGREEE